MERAPTESNTPALVAILLGLAAILGGWSVGWVFLDGFSLDLGSSGIPAPRYSAFLLFFVVFAGAATVFITTGLSALLGAPDRLERLRARWTAIEPRTFVVAMSLLAFVMSLLVRHVVLYDTAITDDEPAYRFMAQLLASGQIYGDSPELKLFYDRAFMVNDGKFFSQYFLGWPALLAPGVLLGVPELMNPLYSALTIPALYLVTKQMLGESWAKVGCVLYLASPMVIIGAATELSHTSCIFALAWMHVLVLRSRRDDAAWWVHAAVAGSFCVAFFIRPLSALGLGVPLLVVWFLGAWKRSGTARFVALASFGLVAGTLAAVFFAINAAQSGDPLVVAYVRAFDYAADNGHRFSAYPPGWEPETPNLGFDPKKMAATLASGLLRFNFAAFGWPCAYVFVAMAGFRRPTRLAWALLGFYLVVHLPLKSPGIDSYGPVHLSELLWPVLLLSTAGLANLHRWGDRLCETFADASATVRSTLRGIAIGMPCALVSSSLLLYVPVRVGNLSIIAEAVSLPDRVIEEAGLTDAVVFAPRPFVPPCLKPGVTRPNHYRYWRDISLPAQDPNVVWVNHLSVTRDKELMRTMPSRTGYVMRWTIECEPAFLELSELEPGSMPNGLMYSGSPAPLYPDSMDPSGVLPVP